MRRFSFKPKNRANQVRGAKAQSAGKSFENFFEYACKIQGFSLTRIHDGCERKYGKLLRRKQPFDWLLSKNGKTLCIDTKTRGSGQTFSKSEINTYQLQEMLKHESPSCVCGYIVYFREKNLVKFWSATELNKIIGGARCNDVISIELGRVELMNLNILI